ncbi:MAG: hypothetical protein C0410_07985 [Anaerolinea sp.]|nr:hypothetical protein [Anaerolinea sp.]
MGKTMDYLQWRGDLSFSKDPFNDVDALILSLLSYLPFKGIVPGLETKEDTTLKKTSDLYFSRDSTADSMSSKINPTASSSFDSELDELLKKAASCPRFEDVRLSRYDENTDFVIGRQFAAVTFTLHNPDRQKVVAFRGTDNSLVGWKEDFELAYMEQIPAQESACSYLERTIGILSSQFIVCGHSKGGNLAVYAGSHLNSARQSRLTKIINFDGPGFDFSLVNRTSFSHSEHKIINYVPQESMVGLLLEPMGKRTVVSSSGRYIMQHNALNWEVERSKFVHGKLTSNTKLLESTLKTWLTDISLTERAMFLEALFDILGASEGAAIKFDPHENLKEIKNILVKYSKLDKKTKILLGQVFESLTSETRRTLTATIKEKLPRRIAGKKPSVQ